MEFIIYNFALFANEFPESWVKARGSKEVLDFVYRTEFWKYGRKTLWHWPSAPLGTILPKGRRSGMLKGKDPGRLKAFAFGSFFWAAEAQACFPVPVLFSQRTLHNFWYKDLYLALKYVCWRNEQRNQRKMNMGQKARNLPEHQL